MIHPRTFCCDFHDEPEDMAAHLAKWEAAYGKHVDGVTPIAAPPGWRILPFLEYLPNSLHREFNSYSGWLMPRKGISTMSPMFARPSGKTLAFAVPNEPRK